MSSSSFTSPFDRNTNPFNGSRLDLGRADMYQVKEEDETDTGASPTTPHFANVSANGTGNGNDNGNDNGNSNTDRSNVIFRRQYGGDGTSAFYGGAVAPNGSDGYPDQYNFARRTSVSAESLKPAAGSSDSWRPPFHQKPPEQLQRLRAAIGTCFLFSHLDDEQSGQVLGALQEKAIPAKGIKVIEQGSAGDFFYVVEKGSFDVWVNPSGTLQPGPDGMGRKVDTIMAGGSFGELALMYNAPRAATVISAEPHCTLWALDRLTFRRILMESTFARRRMYESFLEEVPLLASLTHYERSKIADVLESQKYPPNTAIIKEGDPGHAFYLLESGEADAYRNGMSSPVKHYKKGDFFGELALLNDAPRAASVVSVTEVRVASMGKSAFQRLLGPVEGIMRREKYASVEPHDESGVETGVKDVDPLSK